MRDNTMWWTIGGILAVIMLGTGGVVMYNMTRGLRNNNPGNLEYDGTAWEGLANPPSDGNFFIFTAPVYGIRAMARVLSNYVALDGVAPTVTAIITRWAPSYDASGSLINDTAAYIQDVDDHLGLTPGNDPVNLATDLPALVAAIISHENGLQPYSADLIAQGISLA